MKKLAAISLAAAVAASSLGMTALADDDINIIVNGVTLNILEGDTQPFIEDGRTLVPMRAIFEALGATVDWNGETRTITSYDPISDINITMEIDSARMYVNGSPVELDVPAKIVNDRTVVPVRAISESMNCTVDWDGNTRTVTVTKSDYTQIANPWVEYPSLQDLNEVIVASGETYDMKALKDEHLTPIAFRYLDTYKMAEVQYNYSDGDKKAQVTVRKSTGDGDITGVTGGEKTEDYSTNGVSTEIYSNGTYIYAAFNIEAEAEYSQGVIIASNNMSADETVALLKTYIDEIVSSYVAK